MPDTPRPEALKLAQEALTPYFGFDYVRLPESPSIVLAIARALDALMAERDKFRTLIERAVIAPEDHDGGTAYPVAYGEYDDTDHPGGCGVYIPPDELPNIPALERKLAAERTASQAAEEENAALRRQYNEQLDRVARTDAETTRIRYELEALVGAKDRTLEKLLALIVEGPIRPGSIAEQTACGAIRAALALTPADLHARQEAEAKSGPLIETATKYVDRQLTHMPPVAPEQRQHAIDEVVKALAALRAGEGTT